MGSARRRKPRGEDGASIGSKLNKHLQSLKLRLPRDESSRLESKVLPYYICGRRKRLWSAPHSL